MELEKKGCYRFLFGFLGFRLSILGFRVQGLRFRGLGVWGVEFKGFRGLRVVIGLREVLAQDSVDRPFSYLCRHGTSFLRHCHHDCPNDYQ